MTEATAEEDRLVAAVLAPPRDTVGLPGIGGRLRTVLEDFEVTEVPAYPPDGRADAHLRVCLSKRGLSTEDAVRAVAAHLGVSRGEIGVAGKKDRDAVTKQWISVPASAATAVATFRHEAVSIGDPQPQGKKLKIGHLRGNRFRIVARETVSPPELAVTRARDKLEALASAGGLLNAYGGQRFGREGVQARRGLSEVQRGRGGRRGNMIVAAGQAALFNLYLHARADRGLLRRVVAGDVLRKTDTGGMFDCAEPEIDQARFDAGEVEITGPIYGSRMRAPPPGSTAAELEAGVLAQAEVEPGALSKLGRAALGTRRPIRARLSDAWVEPVESTDGLPPGVRVGFALPAGAYATLVMRELMED